MASLDRAFIDDLLSRIDIVEIISAVVQLKKHVYCIFHTSDRALSLEYEKEIANETAARHDRERGLFVPSA